MTRRREGTARLRAINETAKTAAHVIAENLEGRKVGRPPKYVPEFCHIARSSILMGSTSAQFAELLGVWPNVINKWMEQYPDFREAVKQSREMAIERVEQALYHRAIGYSHRSEKIFQYEGGVIRAEYDEHYPPENTAMIFYLKNVHPTKWRERIDPPGSTPEEAARYIRDALSDLDTSTTGEKDDG